ncbi:MAG: ATP-binding protein [Clostridiales Family XIII bacterium]|jgi:predicted AAA+ superfamily ATPase|nr:ATP-binding protein [Clostridiales Family XIII bacterium]
MNYIHRSLERKFTRMSAFFKAVLVTGARQVGKTTMLRHLANEQNRTYVTLDNLMARSLAKSDPVMFFQTYKPPIIIDEVQYAPELFTRIKILCDESDETGLFWLTGSQQFDMMKNVRETLPGRVGILELYSLSKNEKDGIEFENDLDFSLSCLQARQTRLAKNDVANVFEHIWRGGMPQVFNADAEQRQEYYNAYVAAYLMRDAAELGGVTDTLRFGKFLIACAALISEQVNYKTLSDAAEISQPTAKEWLRLLQGMGIIHLLQPYANNALKRLTKTPKLYFYDTGLPAHLSMWLTRDTLMNGAASGHYFENFVISELLKSYAYSPTKARMSYYRDSNAKEIDIFVEQNNSIHPIEIKKSANPDRRDVKKFTVLDKASIKRGNGGIICMCEEVVPIDHENCFIPCNLI